MVHADAIALAPVAVLPLFQRKGIGSELIHAGIERCKERRMAAVIVLGDPRYYGRFGFTSTLTATLKGPFAGEHWMALELQPNALTEGGTVIYPPAFDLV